ncbi:MAG: DUF6531 domain-containing protein, partial [Candidatus Thiodiazotropha sp. 6PDIVS]
MGLKITKMACIGNLIVNVFGIMKQQYTNAFIWKKKLLLLSICSISMYSVVGFADEVIESWINDGPNPSYFYHHKNESITKDQALTECNAAIALYDASHACHNAGNKTLGYQATGGWVEDMNNPRHNHLFTYYYPQYFSTFEISDQCPLEEGDPCNPATGVMTRTESDYISADGTLKIKRYYSSQGISDGFNRMGYGWRHNYSYRINGYGGWEVEDYKATKSGEYFSPDDACEFGWSSLKSNYRILSDSVARYHSGRCEIVQNNSIAAYLQIRNTRNSSIGYASPEPVKSIKRFGSNSRIFYLRNGEWISLYPTSASLQETADGWSFRAPNGSIEIYNADGRLLSRRDRSGINTSFSYDDQDRLFTVTGHYGKTLTFQYGDNDNLAIITTPDGDIRYEYDVKGRLSHVINVDGSERFYYYENIYRPNAMTGITDENANRFVSWTYDTKGRALTSEHANGADRVTFTYNADGSTKVKDAAGAERTYHFVVKQGAMKVDRI